MSFKLRIPGRDDIRGVAPPANPANPLIQPPPISRLAGLAANEDWATDRQTVQEPPALASSDGTPLGQADRSTGFEQWTGDEISTFQRRHARIVWIGYADRAEALAEKLLHRDRDADDRRLCVECGHAGPAWRCNKRAGFLLDQLQRCDCFAEANL